MATQDCRQRYLRQLVQRTPGTKRLKDSHYRGLTLLTVLLCFGIIVLGAYVRLSDAGLGCPDWPGCYGQILVPEQAKAEQHAGYAQRPLETGKAWKEMIHRYFASGLGLCIIALAVLGWRRGLPRGLLAGLVALVCFQGILGMWTVTWQLKPLAVTAHLLGGLSTLGLLIVLLCLQTPAPDNPRWRGVRRLALVALLVLAGQVFLGGWTSSNYAALACTDVPTCHGQWWPETDYAEAFVLWRGLGVNYEFGVLDSPARTAIHLTHRMGAIIAASVLAWLAWCLWRRVGEPRYAGTLAAALVLQLSLGVLSVMLSLPLAVAAAHNAGAALLAIVLVTINVAAWRARSPHDG